MDYLEKYGERMALEHISTRYFNNSIGWDEKKAIKKKYADPKWEKAKLELDENSKISKSAIRIAEVMKAKMDIDLFPSIHKIACKGWSIGGGTFAFYMVDDKGNRISFSDHAALYKSMKANYVWYAHERDGYDECIMRN